MKIPFSVRLGLAIFGICSSITLGISVIIYSRVSSFIWEELSSRLMDLNRLAISQISNQNLNTIQNIKNQLERDYPFDLKKYGDLKEGDSISTLPKEKIDEVQNSDEFQDIVQLLRKVKFSTAKNVVPKEKLPQVPIDELDIPLVSYVYIYTNIPGDMDYKFLRTIVDSNYDAIDSNKNGIIDDPEAPDYVGSIYNSNSYDTQSIQNAFRGKISCSTDYTSDKWGIWISSFGPISNSKGEVIAILGIDMDAEGEFNLLRKLKIFIFVVQLISLVFSILVSYFFSRYYKRSMSALIEGAKTVSQNDYSIKIHVKSNDEIGLLANTFNQMVASISEMKNNLERNASSLEIQKKEALHQKELAIEAEKKVAIELEKSERLNQMIQVIINSSSIEDMLQKIYNLLSSRYNLSSFAVMLIDEQENKIKFYKFYGKSEISEEILNFIHNFSIPMSDTNSLHVISILKAKSVYLPIFKRKEVPSRSENDLIQFLRIRGFYIVPMIVDNHIIGTIDFSSNLFETEPLIQLSKAVRDEVDEFVRLVSPSIYQSLQKEIIQRALSDLKETSLNLKLESERAKKAYYELEASQKQLIQSDRMITLGTMVAGVAHEINTPLAAIKSNSENISENLKNILISLDPEYTNLEKDDLKNITKLVQLSNKNIQSTLSTKELRAQKKQINSLLEKLNIRDTESYTDFISELGLFDALESNNQIFEHSKIKEYLNIVSNLIGIKNKSNVIQLSADRVSKIVKSLKSFMHFEQKDEMILSDLIEGMETVLIILHSKLKLGIEVVKKYAEIPKIYCYPDELNQIWTNLIHNAIQAMNNSGELLVEIDMVDSLPENLDIDKISTDYRGSYVSISIQDSGSGISPEIRTKIFEAFFTTKPAGEGSGLGLHIIGKILEKHRGGLFLESKPGKTRFTIYLPNLQHNKQS